VELMSIPTSGGALGVNSPTDFSFSRQAFTSDFCYVALNTKVRQLATNILHKVCAPVP